MRKELPLPVREKIRAPHRSSVKPPGKTYGRILSVCSYCRQFRGEDGDWHPLSLLRTGYPDLRFSHGICPTCAEALYPELYEAVTAKRAAV